MGDTPRPYSGEKNLPFVINKWDWTKEVLGVNNLLIFLMKRNLQIKRSLLSQSSRPLSPRRYHGLKAMPSVACSWLLSPPQGKGGSDAPSASSSLQASRQNSQKRQEGRPGHPERPQEGWVVGASSAGLLGLLPWHQRSRTPEFLSLAGEAGEGGGLTIFSRKKKNSQ